MAVNKVIILGNLGADPELRYSASGAAVCNFRVATNERWTDKDGTTQERTEWHKVVVWGRQAENCEKYLAKGRQVYVEGRLQTREWDDKDGNKRHTTEVIAQSVQFLSGGNSSNSSNSSDDGASSYDAGSYDGAGFADDIPFAFPEWM